MAHIAWRRALLSGIVSKSGRKFLLLGVLSGAAGAMMLLPRLPALPPEEPQAASLKAEIEALKGLLADQAHAMADVGYQFTNCWFAVEKKNWALAAFYLGETRSHLHWAVRIKPVRKNSAGEEVNLMGILEAVENSFLAELQKQIDAKNAVKFAALYKLALEGCYSCHKASEKPYLRLQIPEGPETRIINFDPEATWPQ
jgi:hypothetical protein